MCSHESHCGMTICYVSGIKLFITGILHATYFANFFYIYTPPHNSGGILWFHVGLPCVYPSVARPSVHPSVFRFRMIT